MSLEENKALMRRFEEELWKGNVTIVDEVMVANSPQGNLTSSRLELMKAFPLDTLKRMPDVTLKIEAMIAEGDQVWYRWTLQGTPVENIPTPWSPVTPTGKAVAMTGVTMVRLQDGKVVEEHDTSDIFGFFQRLGVIPAWP